jgi:hypothetical protein
MRLPLVLLIIITTSRVHQYFGLLNAVRPGLLLFLWASFMFFAARKKRLAAANWKELPARLVLGLGIAVMLSIPFGISIGGSALFFLDNFSKVVIISLLVSAAIVTADDLWTMTWAYVIGVGVLAWMTITVYHMESASGSGISRLSEGSYAFPAFRSA